MLVHREDSNSLTCVRVAGEESNGPGELCTKPFSSAYLSVIFCVYVCQLTVPAPRNTEGYNLLLLSAFNLQRYPKMV